MEKQKIKFVCRGSWWIPCAGFYLFPSISVYSWCIDLRWGRAMVELSWHDEDDLPF